MPLIFMKINTRYIMLVFAGLVLSVGAPTLALATQTHGEPEGLVVHQITHLVFIFSMGTLIFWLRKRKLVVETGWRYIQYAALLFILWNLDAFAVHFWMNRWIYCRSRRSGPGS